MKLLLAICLVALTWQNVKAQCSEVDNCQSCTNPGPECGSCQDQFTLSNNKDSCIFCGDNCERCDVDANDNAVCLECMDTYYLTTAAACETCGDGCVTCAMVNEVLTCSECEAEGYTQQTAQSGTPCVECGSNCQTCSMHSDGESIVCNKCYTYPGLSLQGYYYRTSDDSTDRTCRSCGSKASVCNDDGTGAASITDCYEDYEVQSDNSRCLSCPAACETCSGEELSGSATCTSCKDDLGNFLTNGECLTCGDNCLNCDDGSTCGECVTGYRVDGASCLECPAMCDECEANDETGNDDCKTCESNYGEKPTASVTCDKCTKSNCKDCDRSNSGAHTCNTCIDGYGKDEDGECAQCGTGCNECAWDTTDAKLVCSACMTGYTGPSAADTTLCIACTTADDNCATCTGDADPATCTVCTEDYHYKTDTTECVANDAVTNCVQTTASYNVADGACTACEEGYKPGATCDVCTDNNCKTCSADVATCEDCNEGYTLESGACLDCGVSRCLDCNVDGNGDVIADECTSCPSGYAIYDGTTKSTSVGSSCRRCTTGCDACTWDYDNNVASCSSCNSGYTTGGDNDCPACPENCDGSCTYSSDSSSTRCDSDGDCAAGYGLNTGSGECDECPSDCTTCTWSDDLSSLECTDCDTSFGEISSGQCGACPGNCVACSADDAENPDVLTCGTCTDGYASNDGVCGACPSNCIKCKDDDATMTCETCKSGYALDSKTKECVACFGNCATCTSSDSVVKCTDCNSGYSLPADGLSCIICSEAAFENCAVCSDIDATSGIATCEACTSSYVLQDEKETGPCIDVSSLTCDSEYRVDVGPQCSTCNENYLTTEEGLCAINCWSCGSFASPVAQDSCKIPSGNATGGQGFAAAQSCTTGVCVARYFPGPTGSGLVYAGCADGLTAEVPITCVEEEGAFESCTTGANDQAIVCSQCCTDETGCNSFVADMDGESGSLPACTSNIILLSGAALLAILKLN